MLDISIKEHGFNIYLYASLLTVNVALFSSSTTLVWSSPVIPQLLSNDGDVNPLGEPITPLQQSLIGGLPYLGGILGPLLLGRLCDILGRKKTSILLAVFTSIAFGVLAFATNLYTYYVLRTRLGALLFYCIVVTSVYSTEITEDHNRGKFQCLLTLFHVSGFLYSYVLGLFFPITSYTLLCAAPSVLSIIPMFFIPESPYYLAKKDEAQAIQVLRKLRAKNDVSKDLALIKATINSSTASNKGNWRHLLTLPTNRKACFICFGAMILQECSGAPAIIAYNGPIFNALDLPGNLVSVMLGILRSLAAGLPFILVERFGKRYLMMISTAGCCISFFMIGIYFYLQSINLSDIDKIGWLPVVGVLTYVSFYGIGIGPGATALGGELFSEDAKTLGISVIHTFASLLCFIVTFGFPLVTHFLGMYWPFIMFGIVCGIGVAFVYWFVPRTEGKSYLEIQEILGGNMQNK
ncbi:unnamed protein product [Callosobruchus maculatus]|uniref:Major facilitator superfamily (MFS) profile domain-containing protein n=1 Tax=Callosobruchus maculatus TaxID=64391 RepID=A0A653C4X6_CALMS|nr:unnamed protein product [Callosobruchus maculatus]